MLALLLGIEVITLFLGIKSFGNKNNILDDIKLLDNKSNNLFAIMIQDKNGDYKESDGFPEGKYVINKTLSSCIDSNGSKIDTVFTYVNGLVTLNVDKTINCYLYFDEDLVEIYDKVIEDYNNSKGVEKTADENSKEIYYYTGDITNNNLVLNNYCWKMVRTTETDGVKLIYNGVYADSTKCNNKGTDVYIDSNGTKYSSSDKSPAYVGYMHGTPYNFTTKKTSSLGVFGTYYYGNDVTWNGTTYTLSDAEKGAMSTMYSKLSTKHYTCLSTSLSCSTVYYIYYMTSATGTAYYITLTSGKKVEDVLDEMLNYNTTNSNVKTEIDNWYNTNMTNVTDYLENAIYCNNRNISDLGGWNPNGGGITNYLYFNDYNISSYRLTCQDKEDQFTLKVESGGTLGYGNNALDYSVGLLTSKEITLAKGETAKSYLNVTDYFWTLSPIVFASDFARVRLSNNYDGYSLNSIFGVRPAISLKKTIKITGGTGEIEDPYTLSLN